MLPVAVRGLGRRRDQIWVAAHFLGSRLKVADAIAIEALIQAVSSAAFFVPGALGVQEGGFVLIGGALGLDPATSLALAGSRRIRDLIVFLPGLVAWQVAESTETSRGIVRSGDASVSS